MKLGNVPLAPRYVEEAVFFTFDIVSAASEIFFIRLWNTLSVMFDADIVWKIV